MESELHYKNITIKPSAYTDDFDFKKFLAEYENSLKNLNNNQMKEEREYRSHQMIKFPTIVNVRMNLIAQREMLKRGLEKGIQNQGLSQREF